MQHVRRSSVPLLAAVAGVLFAAPAAAQETPAYRRTPGDTLHFREVITGQVSITSAQGSAGATTSHDALIALTFLGGDTAQAWFEEISLGIETGGQSMNPPSDPLLDRPYTLRFTERGHVQTTKVPEFPAQYGQMADLARQFDDFFLRLPAQPLRAGLTWSDTVTMRDSTSETQMRRMRRIGRYRVTGDTTIAGERAMVIGATLETEIEATTPTPGQAAPARAELGGSETATFFFAPDGGRFLGRVREGQIAGVIRLGGANGMEMKQRLAYTSRIEAVR